MALPREVVGDPERSGEVVKHEQPPAQTTGADRFEAVHTPACPPPPRDPGAEDPPGYSRQS